ncbi:MAG: thioredoxin family protein [Erysipelotrichaceae bacterium]
MKIFNNKEVKSEKECDVKILGGGCAKCNQLEANTIIALKELGLISEVQHIKDYAQIASYGVMSTPAIVYKNQVISYGKVLSSEEIVKLLKAIV